MRAVRKTHFLAPLLLSALLVGGPSPPTTAAAASTAPSADSTDPRVQRMLIQGTTQMHLGDYEEAISYFEAALRRAPKTPALLDALADAHEEQGDLPTALFYARQARQHGSAQPYYHRRLAEVQRAAGEPTAALRTYQELLDRFPDQAAVYRAQAALQAKLGRTEAAARAYETYLHTTYRPPLSVHRRLLSLYRDLGDTEGIGEILSILVNRRPNARTYRRRLGEHYAETGRPKDALALLAPLAREYPDDQALQKQVQRLAQETGRPMASVDEKPPSDSSDRREVSTDELLRRAQSLYSATTASKPPDTTQLRTAETLLRRVLNRSPDHKAALSLRARLYENWGRYQDAGEVLEQLLDLDPRSADRWTRATRAYRQANRPHRTAEVAEEGFLLFPGHRPLARIAAFAHLRSDAPTRARRLFRDALSLVNDSTRPGEQAVLNAGLGLALSQLDRPGKADEVLEKACSLAPDHPRVLRLYARSLAHRRERLDQALDQARQATKHAPESPAAHHTLGWVHYRRGELEAARRHLRTALDAGTPSVTLLERIGDVEQALGNDAAARTYWRRAAERAPDRASPRGKLKDSSGS